MLAHGVLRLPNGRRYELVHGDLIGRLWSAALPLDDARVSEAHAMVSLREGELRLIALRGAFAVGGRPVNEVSLEAGMEITLARGLVLEVEAVVLPPSVMGLEGEGLPRQVLPPVSSIVGGRPPRVQRGFLEGAAAWIWGNGDSFKLRLGASTPMPLRVGQSFEVEGCLLTAVEVPLKAAGLEATRPQGGVSPSLRVEAHFDTVHIQSGNDVPVVLGGVPARLISELVSLGGPAHWTVLTGLLWPKEPDPEAVRSRLDVNLSRLRRKLREARIRTDLVIADGNGYLTLLFYPQDVVEDHT